MPHTSSRGRQPLQTFTRPRQNFHSLQAAPGSSSPKATNDTGTRTWARRASGSSEPLFQYSPLAPFAPSEYGTFSSSYTTRGHPQEMLGTRSCPLCPHHRLSQQLNNPPKASCSKASHLQGFARIHSHANTQQPPVYLIINTARSVSAYTTTHCSKIRLCGIKYSPLR